MNYILEIKAFYDWAEYNQLKASHISLWHGLMHIANKSGWKDEFTVPMSTLELRTGLKRSTIYEARNRLKQWGRIEFTERDGNQSAVYKIIPLCPIFGHNPDTIPTESRHNPDEIPTKSRNINKQDNSIDDNDNNRMREENIVSFYENNIGTMPGTVYQEIVELSEQGISDEVICAAIKESVVHGANNWAYARKILNDCVRQKIYRLDDLRAYNLKYKNSKKQTQSQRPNYSNAYNTGPPGKEHNLPIFRDGEYVKSEEE